MSSQFSLVRFSSVVLTADNQTSLSKFQAVLASFESNVPTISSYWFGWPLLNMAS